MGSLTSFRTTLIWISCSIQLLRALDYKSSNLNNSHFPRLLCTLFHNTTFVSPRSIINFFAITPPPSVSS
ncbi:hypothetical protein PGT21_035010 [Puccinia graminis f. sp. tritici]|uniref:Secreted protein n=1 Tax=Puccinia graminis f. sp. tritici TaxID=56615 RepID=A0A5B0PDK0_PUCGR|nr:hypothetical protein PGT21_035010 [Puccinia graminis f. sp. tritici]